MTQLGLCWLQTRGIPVFSGKVIQGFSLRGKMSEDDFDKRPPFGRELFLEWRSPRFGASNPAVLSNPVWEWLIRTRIDAYQATKEFKSDSSFNLGPCWCFMRYGQSTTILPDGRKIYIAGEHEDDYDPDFYIYNDVVIENPDGTIVIYGYPKEAFPPTDFHTASLIGNHILIVGNLGYPNERKPHTTQVLRLNLENFQMEIIQTGGNPPGWIHQHTAKLLDGNEKLIVSGGISQREEGKNLWENVDDWELDLSDWVWTRKTDKQWQHWAFIRKDKKPNWLWRIRSAEWSRKYMKEKFANELEKITAGLKYEPNLELLPQLYRLDDSTIELPERENEYGTFRISMDDVIVKFKEDHHLVQVLVEGQLKPDRLQALQEAVCVKLNKINGAEWEVMEP
jgi:hypothetical protein